MLLVGNLSFVSTTERDSTEPKGPAEEAAVGQSAGGMWAFEGPVPAQKELLVNLTVVTKGIIRSARIVPGRRVSATFLLLGLVRSGLLLRLPRILSLRSVVGIKSFRKRQILECICEVINYLT